MVVKNSFIWHRSFSALNDEIKIPSGAPVEYHRKNKSYYVSPSFFTIQKMYIEAHDATYYGCSVPENNITESN